MLTRSSGSNGKKPLRKLKLNMKLKATSNRGNNMNTIIHPVTEAPSEALYQALERMRLILHQGDIDLFTPPQETELYAALEELSGCLAAPIWNLLRGWKKDALLYKQALEEIRDIAACHQAGIFADLADTALKGGAE